MCKNLVNFGQDEEKKPEEIKVVEKTLTGEEIYSQILRTIGTKRLPLYKEVFLEELEKKCKHLTADNKKQLALYLISNDNILKEPEETGFFKFFKDPNKTQAMHKAFYILFGDVVPEGKSLEIEMSGKIVRFDRQR